MPDSPLSTSQPLESLDIRFAFFDIDGTLVKASHEISTHTVRALRAFRARGANYGLASGHPYFGAKKIIQQLDVTGACVFFSGALVVEPATGKILLEETLSAEQASHVLDFARREQLFVEIYTLEDYFVEAASSLGEIHAQYLGSPPKVCALNDLLLTQPILKLEFVVNNSAEEEKLRTFQTANPGLNFGYGFGAAHADILFVNVTNQRASRHMAFERVVSHLALVPAQIAAFGDAEADMPFITLSGLGVAMGNAPQAVKNVAGFVTKSVEEEGVAFVLDRLGPK